MKPVDVLGDLLRGVRSNGAVLGETVLSAPWSLRFADGADLTLCVMTRGSGWLVPASGEPRRLRAGDIAVVRGPEPFLFADGPAPRVAPTDVRCLDPAACDAVRPEICAGDGATALAVGVYRNDRDTGHRLLGALPPALVVPGTCDDSLLRLISAEITEDRAGQTVVLDRLLDWLLVCTLRAWFDGPDAAPPAWYRALADPVVGPALRAMHEDPARPWTTAALAAHTSVSRAALGKRFTALVGEPPLTYLTSWRMALAAELLADDAVTLAAVARRVGYASEFAFSAAFKRVRGISPSQHRRLSRGGERTAKPAPAGAARAPSLVALHPSG